MTALRHATQFAAANIAILGFAVLSTPAQAADTAWPAEVKAHYKLKFNGLKVGNFHFTATSDGNTYRASSNTEVSALFGAFKWRGAIEARGTLANQPKPAGYKLAYASRKKDGIVEIGYGNGAVTKVKMVPESHRSPEVIPVREEHLQNVIDPMAAMLALSHGSGNGACNQKLEMFDGKQRFRLVLSPKRQEQIPKAAAGDGQVIEVCRVKYVPISGHKPKDFENAWVSYDDIEIALRPVPNAKLYVPHWISIPTTLGAAVMSVQKVDITTSNRQQIGLNF